MTKQEVRMFIMKNYKQLVSTNTKEYKLAYDALTFMFFEHHKGLKTKILSPLEQWQVIQTLTLSLIKGLIQDNETELIREVRTTYHLIREQAKQTVKNDEDNQIFEICEENFRTKLADIILKLK